MPIAAQIETLKPGAVLQIETVPLLGPDGVAADLSVAALGRSCKSIEGVPLGTGTGAVIDIDLSAKLPRLGEYGGYVTLRYGDEKPTVKPIRANRTIVDLPIEVLGVEHIPNQNCWTCWRKTTIWLTLQAPPDRDLTVTPTLTELALNRTGKEKFQASFASQSISVGGVNAANGVTLNSGETKRVAVDLSGLGEAGKYAGKVRFALVGFKSKDQAFTVLVKDAWWFAVIPIVLGAFASMWLRQYRSDRRPRLIVRQRIAKLGEQIDALRRAGTKLDETENRVFDAFNRQLIALYGEATSPDKLSDGWSTAAGATLHRIAQKLPSIILWVNARRLTAALDQSVDATAIPTRLSNIQTALEGETDLTAAHTRLRRHYRKARRGARARAVDYTRK